ncbi:MAG: hypothetical protein Sapg2KO_12420 [Saprospiraceae bacterium]
MDTITFIGLIASLMTVIGVPGFLQVKKLPEARNKLIGLELDFGVLSQKSIKILVWFSVFYLFYIVLWEPSFFEIQNSATSEIYNEYLEIFSWSGAFGLLIVAVFAFYLSYNSKKLVLWEIIIYLLAGSLFSYLSFYAVLYAQFNPRGNSVLPFFLSIIFALLLSQYLYKRKIVT